MAMRSASQQSHIYFRRLVCNCGYLLLCLLLRRFRDFVLTAFSSRRCRLFPGVCRGFSPWNHALRPIFSTPGQVTFSPP